MTAPNRKVRTVLAILGLLGKVGLAPTNEKAIRMPMHKRLDMGPGARLVGKVPDVPTRDATITTRDGASIRVRVYEPAGATAPVLYAHGGGFAIGGFRSCDHICRRIAVEAGVVVVSVEYRLAPEHPFPVPIDDCEDALDWLLAQHWDNRRLIVAGDSAGGNLAAVLALRARSRQLTIAGQLLIYPALDMTASGDGVVNYSGVGVTAEDCRACVKIYLGGADPLTPDASPFHAPDLTGLAPALMVTVEHDPLRSEGIIYAQRLRDAGVPVTELDVPGHVHGSLSIPALYEGIDDIYAAIITFVRSCRQTAVN